MNYDIPDGKVELIFKFYEDADAVRKVEIDEGEIQQNNNSNNTEPAVSAVYSLIQRYKCTEAKRFR